MDTCDALRVDLDRALAAESRCATPALLAARARSAALGDPACTASVLAARGLPVPGTRVDWRGGVPPEKGLRDALAPLLEVYETANFAVRFGPNLTGGAETAAAVGAAFETAWTVELDDLGFEAPWGSSTYKFNVYVADTGNGAPSASGAAGYYYVDDEGYGYVVMSRQTVADDEALRSTAAHEFNHAVQDASATYPYEGASAWYWEASASYIEGVVVPDSDAYATFLPAYALLPDLAVNHFVYPDGTLESLHQYGAFLFLQHLVEVEQSGDPTIIRRSWVEPSPGADPLRVLGDLLEEDGGTLEAAFAESAARGATFDWADEDVYEDVLDQWGGESHPESRRPSAVIAGADGEPRRPPDPPHTYGANYWKVLAVPDGFRLRFSGDDGPLWRLTVATQTGDVHERIDVPVVDNQGDAVVELGDAGQVWVAISAADSPRDDGTTFDYELALDTLEDEPEPVDTGEEKRACGCDGAAGARSVLALALAAALARRRRW